MARFLDPVLAPLQANLALGQPLVALAQLPVQRRLLLGALLELRRHVLAGLAIRAQRELELLAALGDRARDLLERGDHAADGRQERLVPDRRLAQALDPRQPLRALALGPLARPPGRGQLGRDLHATSGVGTFVGRGAPPLDRCREAALVLAGLVALRDRGSVRCDRPLGLAVDPRDLESLALELRAGAELGLGGGLARPDEPVASIALGEHAFLAHGRRLAELAGAGRPHPSGARDRNPVEPI